MEKEIEYALKQIEHMRDMFRLIELNSPQSLHRSCGMCSKKEVGELAIIHFETNKIWVCKECIDNHYILRNGTSDKNNIISRHYNR